MKASKPKTSSLAVRKKQEAGGGQSKAVALTTEQKEIARLRAEVAKLRLERDVAKQAATSFARYLHRRLGA